MPFRYRLKNTIRSKLLRAFGFYLKNGLRKARFLWTGRQAGIARNERKQVEFFHNSDFKGNCSYC
jgi:hypothetical protein